MSTTDKNNKPTEPESSAEQAIEKPAHSATPRRKRPFPNKRRKVALPQSHEKRQKAEFNQQKDVTIVSTFLLLPVYELFTETLGINRVCRNFYNIMHARDHKLTSQVSIEAFTYTVLLSVLNRMVRIANTSKTAIILHTSDLNTITKDILLPDAIATFVETFGIVTLSNGTKVVPFFRDYPRMQLLPGFLDPLMLLHDMELEPEFTNWGLHTRPVLDWQVASTRALKNMMELRTVRYDEIEGRPEFLACYHYDVNGRLSPTSIDKMDIHQCQLGAAYGIRRRSYQDLKFGLSTDPVYGAPDCERDLVLTTHFRNTLRSNM